MLTSKDQSNFILFIRKDFNQLLGQQKRKEFFFFNVFLFVSELELRPVLSGNLLHT
jgi:hypothetical protein